MPRSAERSLSAHGQPVPRLGFVDAARGTAMLLVLMSHFADTYFETRTLAGEALNQIGRIASPTFMLISGLAVGAAFRRNPASFGALRSKLIDRGLFLLIVAHPLMAAALWPTLHTTRGLMITDVAAAWMFVGPWLVRTLSSRSRLTLSLVMYLTGWVGVLSWLPQSLWGAAVQETLVGSLQLHAYYFAFPIVPWLSIALGASVLGEYVASGSEDRHYAKVSGMMARLGALCVTGAVLAKEVYVAAIKLHLLAGDSRAGTVVRALTSRVKSPPSPIYLLFFGGLGLTLLAALLSAERRRPSWQIWSWLEVFGQSSLVMFIIQSFVYYTLIHQVHRHLPFAAAWPLYLILSMLLVMIPAVVWHRSGCARLMTVGYGRWRHHLWPDAGQLLPAASAGPTHTPEITSGTHTG